jgi:hypothetical protein
MAAVYSGARGGAAAVCCASLPSLQQFVLSVNVLLDPC